jgi:hypothetical protein
MLAPWVKYGCHPQVPKILRVVRVRRPIQNALKLAFSYIAEIYCMHDSDVELHISSVKFRLLYCVDDQWA